MLPLQHENMYDLVYFVGCNIPAKFQWHCCLIGGDILNFVSHLCTCTTDDVVSEEICIIRTPKYISGTKKKISQEEKRHLTLL